MEVGKSRIGRPAGNVEMEFFFFFVFRFSVFRFSVLVDLRWSYIQCSGSQGFCFFASFSFFLFFLSMAVVVVTVVWHMVR
ncbi:hypothetical protein B9Z19DRAFT_1096093 [Tuber borchii]|uniref:Transmembrane protein n=1 Tax=Tuber borchii TaxID=42251 RepID=A0A2T6ZBW5_TUBBO|nr:hypothetical protein B9Z19DRAFT_1096093 [Tuber borchii]